MARIRSSCPVVTRMTRISATKSSTRAMAEETLRAADRWRTNAWREETSRWRIAAPRPSGARHPGCHPRLGLRAAQRIPLRRTLSCGRLLAGGGEIGLQGLALQAHQTSKRPY